MNNPPPRPALRKAPDSDVRGALRNVFLHPNVGPFIGRQLIRHLVTGSPTPAYVDRVAAGASREEIMDKVRVRLAQQFSQPLPAHASIGVARPDPAITRASTITLSLDGISTPHRVVGVRWEGGPDGIRQTLALRQIRP